MKKAILTLLMGAILTSAMVCPGFAEDVYVTKHGKKYHHSESKWIQNRDAEKISVEEAIERGLEPSKDYLRWKDSASENVEK